MFLFRDHDLSSLKLLMNMVTVSLQDTTDL